MKIKEYVLVVNECPPSTSLKTWSFPVFFYTNLRRFWVRIETIFQISWLFNSWNSVTDIAILCSKSEVMLIKVRKLMNSGVSWVEKNLTWMSLFWSQLVNLLYQDYSMDQMLPDPLKVLKPYSSTHSNPYMYKGNPSSTRFECLTCNSNLKLNLL